jgi:hypothetical protein
MLKPICTAVGAILGRANEHFHEVVVQGVEELALETPFELRVIKVAGMHVEIVGMDGNGGVFEFDDDLDTFAFSACGKIHQRMLVEAELCEDAIKAGGCGFGHRMIVR